MRVLYLNPQVVEQEFADAMRRLQAELAAVADYEPPAEFRVRLVEELSGRGLWPLVMGHTGEGSAWFRLLGFGLSVHLPSSPVAQRMASYRIGFRRVGPVCWRVLGPDLSRLDRAVKFVARGDLSL